MSMHGYVNIGVFIVGTDLIQSASEPIIKQHSDNINRCSNPDCKKHQQNKNYKDFKFCPSCGASTEPFVREWEEKIFPKQKDIRDILEEENMEDTFFLLDEHNLGKNKILFLDQTDKYSKSFGGYDDFNGNWILNGEKINNLIEDFKIKYNKEIRTLSFYFKIVEVNFGAISYYL